MPGNDGKDTIVITRLDRVISKTVARNREIPASSAGMTENKSAGMMVVAADMKP